MELLKDKVAFVTGGGAGIGEGIAHLFAECGARVFILEKNAAWGHNVAAAIQAKGGCAFSFACDVRKAETIAPVVQDALARFCRIDVLINNAGIYPRQPFLGMTEAQWDEVQDVNLKGIFHCIRLVLPHMVERRSGKIVNISSVNFFLGKVNQTHYGAAKGGVIGLTRALAREAGEHGVYVNCITPGAVEVEAEKQFLGPNDTLEGLLALQSLKRRIVPLDIARVCLFLASEWSDGMTGQTVNVDGGWVMY